MINLAERMRCQTRANLRNRVVPLMIDGCQRWGKKYKGAIYNRAGKVSIEKRAEDPRTTLKLGKYLFVVRMTQ